VGQGEGVGVGQGVSVGQGKEVGHGEHVGQEEIGERDKRGTPEEELKGREGSAAGQNLGLSSLFIHNHAVLEATTRATNPMRTSRCKEGNDMIIRTEQ